MKFLLLSFLLSFQVFGATTFKAKSAASVAGGYVTSLNRFDGSFEIGTANFTVSTGTLTQEASMAMEGNYRGSWATSAAGTLDTVAQTITATDTYDLNLVLSTTDAVNVQVCAVIGAVENACKYVANTTARQKVSWIGQLNTGDAVKLRVKYLGSSGTHKVDNFKFDQYAAHIASLSNQQSFMVNPQTTTFINSYGNTYQLLSYADMSTSPIVSGSGNFTVVNSATAGRIVATTKTTISGSFVMGLSAGNQAIILKNGSPIVLGAHYPTVNGQSGYVTFSVPMNAGDYLEFGSAYAFAYGRAVVLEISSLFISDNVIQTWQDGRGSFKSLTYTEVNALSGNQGLGTFTAGSVEYMIGADGLLHYKGKLTVGTTTSVEARIPFPNGYISGDIAKIPSIQKAGGMDTSIVGANTFGILVEPSVNYFTFGAANASYAPLTKLVGNSLTTGTTISFNFTVPVQGVSSTPTLLALPQGKDNVFSANINQGASIVTQSHDWLTIASGGAGLYNITYKNLNLTKAPTVNITGYSAGGRRFYSVNSPTTTGCVVRISDSTDTAVNDNFTIEIVKQAPDYTPQGVVPVNITPDTFVQTSGAMNPVHFSVSYGTTNATTVCSASPCSYLDQIGNYVTSVTRTGTGAYVLNATRTYSKMKCMTKTSTSATRLIEAIDCSNCSSIVINSVNNSFLAADSFGTLMCDAIP